MDDTVRAVRAYLRAWPEVNGGHRVDGDAIVVGLAGDDGTHATALTQIAGERLVVQRAERNVRDLLRVQARIEADEPTLAAHRVIVHGVAARPLDGVIAVELSGPDEATARAVFAARYGDAVAITWRA